MIYRDATATDVPWLARVALDNYREVFAPLLPGCDWSRFDEAHFSERFSQTWPRVRIVTAVAPLGFSLVTLAHIDMFFIDRAAQGRGIGRCLLDDTERRGARSLETFAVNAGARRFYERQGWRPTEHSSRIFAGAECNFVRYEKG